MSLQMPLRQLPGTYKDGQQSSFSCFLTTDIFEDGQEFS